MHHSAEVNGHGGVIAECPLAALHDQPASFDRLRMRKVSDGIDK